jgi:hypothetical protein
MRVSERLIGAGQATPDVLLRARAERSELLQQIEEARRQRDAARRGFNLLRNRDEDVPITLADDSTLLRVDSLSRGALLAHALTHREELAQAGSGISLARAQQRIASSAYLPNLALAASYGVQGDRYRFNSRNDVGLASLVMSWNAFNGGQDAARREQANATRSEAEYRRREAERAIALQVGNAYDAVQSARSTLTTASDRLASAERLLVRAAPVRRGTRHAGGIPERAHCVHVGRHQPDHHALHLRHPCSGTRTRCSPARAPQLTLRAPDDDNESFRTPPHRALLGGHAAADVRLQQRAGARP